MTWQEETFDKWQDLVLEDGDDFEAVAKTSLQYAAWLVETAIHHPEWAVGFVRLAKGGGALVDEPDMLEMFPVAMPV